MERYEQALQLFGIESGFVDEHLEDIYEELLKQNNPDIYEFLSPEYNRTFDKRHEIKMSYYQLHSIFKNYILGALPVRESSNEKLEEETFRLLYDSIKGKKELDERFISKLTEIMVINLGLNEYVRRIQFQYYNRGVYANYGSESRDLIVYFESIKKLLKNCYDSTYNEIEKEYSPYCQIVSIMRHEIEHAEQELLRVQNGSDIYTRLSVARKVRFLKRNQEAERLVNSPIIIYPCALLIRKIKLYRDYRIYYKNWSSIPTERMADIKAYNFVLNLLSRASTEHATTFPVLEEMFMDDLQTTIISGYDKNPAPAISYFAKMKQYEDCLELMELSKSLSLEERLAFGLSVLPTELDSYLEDNSKVLQKIRMM